jgi:hypothetical protein
MDYFGGYSTADPKTQIRVTYRIRPTHVTKGGK